MRTLALLLCAFTALVSCDSGSGLTKVDSNDIDLQPDNLVFKRAKVGRFEVLSFEIRQGGETDLEVENIYIRGFEECDRVSLGISPAADFPADKNCPFIIDERPELPAVLGQGQAVQVSVRFAPLDDMFPEEAILVVENNVRDKEEEEVKLRVQGASPSIAATETTISFPGGAATQTSVLIQNVGTGPLNVSSFTLTLLTPQPRDAQTGDPIEEIIIDADNSLPWVIEEQQTETVLIDYAPFDDIVDQAELTFFSDDPEKPEYTITLTSAEVFGVLEVSPNPVEFGTSDIGRVEKVVTLTNAGLATIGVLSITIPPPAGMETHPDYQIGGSDLTSFPLRAGTSRALTVVYNPQSAGGSDAELVIESDANNADANNLIRVPLVRNAQTLPALVEVMPIAVNFDGVAPGESDSAEISIRNPGGQALSVSAIRLSTAEDQNLQASDPEFSIGSGGGAQTIDAGDTHTVTVDFVRPEGDSTLHFGALVIESAAASSPDVVYMTANAPAQE